MAEFASAIFGLIAVGAKTSNSLYTLIDTFRDAPNEILALSDEVTDFRKMLSSLLEVNDLGEWTPEEHDTAKICLKGAVKNGQHVIENIQALINRVRKERLEKDGETQVNRFQWMRIVKKAKKLQELLRVQKSAMCNFIALRTLYDPKEWNLDILSNLTIYRKCSARHGLHVTRLEMKMDMVLKNQLSLMEKQKGFPNESDIKQERDDVTDQVMSKLPRSHDQQTILSEWSANASSRKTAFPHSLSMKTSISCHRPNAPKEKRAAPFSLPNTPTATPLSCLEDCRCQCHFRSVIRSPRLLSNCLGDIILGFCNLPWAVSRFSQCDEQTCRRKRAPKTEVKYFLPSWFGYAVANFKVDFAVRFLPLNVRVRTLNTIPYDSPILVCTQEGNLEGIIRLLQSGAASLYDVDPYGLGLLYYASYYCWRSSGKDVAVRTCQFLLDIGADTDMEDERGSTPLDTLIGDTLVSLAMKHRGMPDSSDFEHITQLFGKSGLELVADFVKVSNFATIHKVLLGIEGDHKTLNDYLGKSESTMLLTDSIDIPDSTGRSALAWAVEYGWANATRILLKHGANPHQLVRSSGVVSPLLHLAIAMPVSASTDNGSLDVVRELLKAGADINAVDHENWTPLHVAASWNNYDIIRELVTFGGDALDLDLVTNDNQSAMDLSLNGGINERVQDVLKNRELVDEHIIGAEDRTRSEGHRHAGNEDFDCEGEEFFDSEEVWSCV
ncbi:hypothetical protein PRK78_003389 [Emydomyces testavorans]|uniref:Azaphilone pigments biosynthesis cluster protein L N-terminal domain-containing protein n=1 Tax=Emydomyces testavorans TaxID=2070801 RepID=A0AAF0DI13_9EURO|nr:hypothetical protein PRK78_003389 [Emydomyces testavorans]